MTAIRLEPNPRAGDECWLLIDEKEREIGTVERLDSNGFYLVEWGSGYGWRRRFQTPPEMIQFINEHADVIAEGEEV